MKLINNEITLGRENLNSRRGVNDIIVPADFSSFFSRCKVIEKISGRGIDKKSILEHFIRKKISPEY
jgi:hypothetical protein